MKQPIKAGQHSSWKEILATGDMAGGNVWEQNVTRINVHHTRSAAHILSPGARHS